MKIIYVSMYFILFFVFTVQTLANGIMGLVLSQSRKRSSNLVSIFSISTRKRLTEENYFL